MGTRFGAYEIRGTLGAGGMGEVYRAHDTTLDRDVALKILPEAFASDSERLMRFEREARMLAALNHPHIAQIYGIEESNGTRALVMELVDGETLGERLARGPLSLNETLAIARQVAEALETAHEKGIVHRDLKPANIKLRPDGTAKVLDFGLAKAIQGNAEGDSTQSPTVTEVGTRAGVILGTAAYMSPEQARGQAVDKRTDVWAFGCVLYEMLTRRAAFAGGTVSDTIARILEREPDWSRVPAPTPPGVRRLLRRCLQRDLKLRQRDMGDVQVELHDVLHPPPETDSADVRTRARPVVLVLVTAAVIGAAAVAALIAWALRPAERVPVSRFSHLISGGQESALALGAPGSVVAIASDGSTIVYATIRQLYRRGLGELDAEPIRGTDGSPAVPFFSPDGQTVGYWDAAAGELRRIALAGGTPISLTRATTLYGASWELDGTILYGQQDGIWRVSANGGIPEQVVQIEARELAYGPRLLPDRHSVLFSLVERAAMRGQSSGWDTARIVVQRLATGERHELLRGSDARVLPTGHLVHALGTVLLAVPFDLAKLEISGAPVPVAEDVQRAVRGREGQGGSANYDVSRSGTLVYVPEVAWPRGAPRRLLAVDFAGNAEPLIEDERDYWRPRISPDGRRVAVEVLQPDLSSRLWIVDLERGTSTPLAVEGGYAAWTPDGESVVYRHQEGAVYAQAASGTGRPRVVLEPTHQTVRVGDVSRDWVVAFAIGSPQDDIRLLDLKSGAVSEFLATPAREYMPSFSPDGKWLAYTSNESGADEVYVRPFPRAEGFGRLVSVDGGAGPIWAPDGSALYYRGASADMMAVPVTPGEAFAPGRPRALFRFAGLYRMSGTAAAYDIHPDGKRFTMVSEPETAAGERPRQQVNVVLNWFDELTRLGPTR